MDFNQYKNKVGLKVNQLFTKKISDNYGLTRVSSSKNRLGTDFVVIHTTANTATAKQEAQNIANNNGEVSFHAVVDEDGVYETVRFKDVAHHAGNKNANLMSLGFELSELNIVKGYDNFVKYVGWVLYQLGMQPNRNHIKLHSEFVATSCGTYYKKKGLENVINDIKYYYNLASSKVDKPKPTPKPTPSKPKYKLVNDKVVNDVINGTYGNGQSRNDNLAHEGYNPKEVQDAVNAKLTGKSKPQSNGRYINIHAGRRYGTYPMNVQPISTNLNHAQDLRADKLGGLSYKIRGNTKYSNVYKIRTRDFGERQIFLDTSRADITNKPKYKVYG